jgi:hypothetical protein
MASVLIERELEAVEAEELTVLRWRREQFGSLGFELVESRLLAESPADLGQARRLCASACPLDVAYRILT